MLLPKPKEMPAAIEAAMSSGEMRGSFSQFGEDGVLWWIFESKWSGFYVDVGCYSPYRCSNTAALHLYRGWSGINIDADRRAIEKFNDIRPKDINICCGVGIKEGVASMAVFEDGAVNSLDPSFHESGAYDWMRMDPVDVQVRRLDNILAEHLPPNQKVDFLNIDAEGLDYDVLTTNDWQICDPYAIAIEAHGFEISRPEDSKTFNYLKGKGYRLLSHVLVTSIYVNSLNLKR